MKVGLRTPSPTRSVKARTTGRVKRAAKKSINPFYGHKGMGYLKDPERAVKNKIYHKVTVDPLKPLKDAKWPEIDTDIELPDIEYEPMRSSVRHPFIFLTSLGITVYCEFILIFRLLAYRQLHLRPALIAIIGAILCVALYKHKS